MFLVLSAVICRPSAVIFGLMILDQPFGIVMTGIGIIALAGIIVNNNIVLIDTYDHLKKTDEVPARSAAGHRRAAPASR